MDITIPERVVRFREENGQTADPRIAKVVKKHNRFLKKYKKLNDPDFLKRAQDLLGSIRKIIRRQEKYKLQTKLKNPDPKSFWSTIKSMVGHNEVQQIALRKSGETITDKKLIAEEFANFFQKKVDDLERLNPVDSNVEADGPAGHDWTNFTEDEILACGKSIRNKKLYGSDGIPLKIVKDIARNHPRKLLMLVNSFAQTGLPKALKTSRIYTTSQEGYKRHSRKL